MGETEGLLKNDSDNELKLNSKVSKKVSKDLDILDKTTDRIDKSDKNSDKIEQFN